MKKLAKLLTLLFAVTALCFTLTACGGGSNPNPTTTPSVGTSLVPSVSPTPSIDWETVFSVNGTGKTITDLTAYGKTLSKIEIPAAINGTAVTSIGDYAFYNCDSLTEIVIPEGVTSIGDAAFDDCTSLTEIVIPESVTSIGSGAFSSCDSLTEIVIPNSITSIGGSAFYSCDSLTIYCEATSQPSGWNSDWNYSSCPVVWNCKNNEVAEDGAIYKIIDGIRYALKDGVAMVVRQPRNISGSITIPASITYQDNTYAVTSIGDSAFYFCRSLTTVTFGENSRLTSIGNQAFYYCTSLTEIVIPEGVTSMGFWAFRDCSSLTIYCEAASEPSGWNYDWNYSNRPVVWGYTGE